MSFVNVKILLLILFSISMMPVFAQSDETPFLTVKTDDSHYDEGDTIVISGQVATIIVDTPVILQVWHEGNMMHINQFFPAQDGSFSDTVLAEGEKWKNEGEYLIRIIYGERNIAETNLDFTPTQEYLETTDSIEVQIPNGGTFDVEYTIAGGIVKDMILDPEDVTLRVLLEAPDEGTISLKIPRDSLDAEKPDGQDEIFIVLIDNIQFPYEEVETNSQTRLITINFEEQTSMIEIIGTFAIPEFGTMVMVILLIGTVTTVLVSKSRMNFQI